MTKGEAGRPIPPIAHSRSEAKRLAVQTHSDVPWDSDSWRTFLGGYLRGLAQTDRYDLPTTLRTELFELAERVHPILGGAAAEK